MKLAINCLSVNNASALGVRTFLLTHLQQFSAISRRLECDVELLFLVQNRSALKSDIVSLLAETGPRVSVRINEVSGIANSIWRVFYEQFVLPALLRDYDTLYSINNANPLCLFGDTRSIITIHDLLPFKAGARYSFPQQVYLKLFTKLCARAASRVITVSQATKNELSNLLGVAPDKISVIYNCLSAPFAEIAAPAEQYLLVVGGLNADKRVHLTLHGFARFLHGHPDSQLRLMIAGPDQGAREELEELAGQLGLGQRVRFLGQVSEEKKNELLSGCQAIVMMGRSEGFGIPVLEAMRFGRPSLVADAGALPEVLGNAGVVVKSPEDAGEVAEGIRAIAASGKNWAAVCRSQYARFRTADASDAFWTLLLEQQGSNG